MTNLLKAIKNYHYDAKIISNEIKYKFNESISENTIRSYMYGKRDIANAKFKTIRMIAFILDDIDGDYNDMDRYAYMMKFITEA